MRLESKHRAATVTYTVDLAPQLAQGEVFNAPATVTVMAGDVVCNPLSVSRTGTVIQFTLSGGTAWTDCVLQGGCATDQNETFAWDMQVFVS